LDWRHCAQRDLNTEQASALPYEFWIGDKIKNRQPKLDAPPP
jgi:hypothetical protein